MPLITSPDNLRESFLLAARGKSAKEEVKMFRSDLDDNLQEIAEGLNTATYDFSKYRQFMVYEPKPRVINAAPFAVRVALQAMMRVCRRCANRNNNTPTNTNNNLGLRLALSSASQFEKKRKNRRHIQSVSL